MLRLACGALLRQHGPIDSDGLDWIERRAEIDESGPLHPRPRQQSGYAPRCRYWVLGRIGLDGG